MKNIKECEQEQKAESSLFPILSQFQHISKGWFVLWVTEMRWELISGNFMNRDCLHSLYKIHPKLQLRTLITAWPEAQSKSVSYASYAHLQKTEFTLALAGLRGCHSLFSSFFKLINEKGSSFFPGEEWGREQRWSKHVILLEIPPPGIHRRGKLSSVFWSTVVAFIPYDSDLDSAFQEQVNHNVCLT